MELANETPLEVRFGESWDNQALANYYSLQYKFKPQSATREGQGALQIENNTCTFWSGHDGDLSHAAQFQGQCAPVAEGQDCIAILENGVWRLELLSAIANMRHIAGTGQVTTANPPSSPKRPSSVHDGQTAPNNRQVKPRNVAPASRQQTPNVSAVESVTPSLSPQPSTTASQDVSDSLPHPASTTDTKPADTHGLESKPHGSLVQRNIISDSQPKLPQASDKMNLSESTETSDSSEGEDEVAQPQPKPAEPNPSNNQVEAGASKTGGDMPDFEREFFQDNSDDESDSVSSDSTANDSEEEAKHF